MNNQIIKFDKPSELKTYLEKAKGSIGMALPKHLNPDRMLRLAMTAFSTTRGLKECSAQSILSSIVVASQLGLEPGIAGQGYLVPYKGTCTFIPGWQGLVGLLNNSGRATAWTGAVFEGDEWDFQLGSEPRCFHRPGPNFGDESKLQWVYACGKVNGAEQPVVEAWNMARVWAHRDKFNKVGESHYSYTNKEMYARKVVLLQVLKYMPRSIELNNALAAANAAEMGRTSTVDGQGKDAIIIDMPIEPEESASKPIFTKPEEKTTEQSKEPLVLEPEELSPYDSILAQLDAKKLKAQDLTAYLADTGIIKQGDTLEDLTAKKLASINNTLPDFIGEIPAAQ